jgi:hypothetical protein
MQFVSKFFSYLLHFTLSHKTHSQLGTKKDYRQIWTTELSLSDTASLSNPSPLILQKERYNILNLIFVDLTFPKVNII